MNDDEWTYQNEDFDEDLPYIELQFGIEDLYLLYKSVSVHLDKWLVEMQQNKKDFLI